MGRSEWGFLIKNKDDLIYGINLIKVHNTSGELQLLNMKKICIYVWEMVDLTSKYFEENYVGLIYWPFNKPLWWFKTKYVWKSTKSFEFPPHTIFD